MKKRWDVIAVIGETENNKPVWMKIGTLILKDNNKLSLKIDVVPINWGGWAEIVPAREQPPKTENTENTHKVKKGEN